MFGRNRIRLDPHLLARVRRVARAAGYSSPEELVTHVLERELEGFEDSDSDQEIRRRLQGLGYID